MGDERGMRKSAVLSMLWIAACVLSVLSSRAVLADPADLLPAEGLDARTPLYLTPMMAAHQKQNMRGHLMAVQQIIVALQTGNYAAIGESAKEMGFSPQMGQMCEMMGAATPGFAEMALKFHHTADQIGAAANKRDRQTVLQALGKTLAICTGCHAIYVQKVVSDGAWEQMMSKPAR